MKNKKTKNPYTRRQFVKTGSAAALAAPLIMQSSMIHGKSISSPNSKINLGIIGCGSLGKVNLANCAKHPDIVVTAACDVWKERLDPVVELHKETCTP